MAPELNESTVDEGFDDAEKHGDDERNGTEDEDSSEDEEEEAEDYWIIDRLFRQGQASQLSFFFLQITLNATPVGNSYFETILMYGKPAVLDPLIAFENL